MFSQLQILSDVIRIVTFSHDAGPERRTRFYVPDDRPYQAGLENRVRRYYRSGIVR